MRALADLDTPHLAHGAKTLKTGFPIKPDFYKEAREKMGGEPSHKHSDHWSDQLSENCVQCWMLIQ